MTSDPQHPNPDTDTHSPWYECFEPQALWAAEPEAPADQPAADLADDDGAMDALFAYYNA